MPPDPASFPAAAFFHESPAFRRLAYLLSSPDLSSRSDHLGQDPEALRRYRRIATLLHKHLNALQQAPPQEPARLRRAEALLAEGQAALSELLRMPQGDAAGEVLGRLEQTAAGLGALAAETWTGQAAPLEIPPLRERPVPSRLPARNAAPPRAVFPAGQGDAPRGATGRVLAQPDGLSPQDAWREFLLAEAARHERAARLWGSCAGLPLLLLLAVCVRWAFLYGLPEAPAASAVLDGIFPAWIPVCLLLAAILAGCWSGFRAERNKGEECRQQAAAWAAAQALAASGPAWGETLLREEIQALCRAGVPSPRR
ncbi:MAG: hypothetical protein LBO77_01595 [Desulfovibrio sp.]|jgi:hypothetical protein|nr:hypothetical protein [Desulfovibrio sp.]